MAIVIKGEMPKGRCWWHDEQGKEHECQFFPCTRDADNCPIIGEIPDKHGRLIDADKLKQVMDDATENDKDNPFCKMMYSYVIQVLAKSPTVLEATE